MGTRRVVEKQKALAATLFSRKQALGVPIHIKMPFILIHIYYAHAMGRAWAHAPWGTAEGPGAVGDRRGALGGLRGPSAWGGAWGRAEPIAYA